VLKSITFCDTITFCISYYRILWHNKADQEKSRLINIFNCMIIIEVEAVTPYTFCVDMSKVPLNKSSRKKTEIHDDSLMQWHISFSLRNNHHAVIGIKVAPTWGAVVIYIIFNK
jgi:hypothetical protein